MVNHPLIDIIIRGVKKDSSKFYRKENIYTFFLEDGSSLKGKIIRKEDIFIIIKDQKGIFYYINKYKVIKYL